MRSETAIDGHQGRGDRAAPTATATPDGGAAATPEAVVGWLGAVQAQEFGVAKWSLAQRSRGQVTSAELDRAVAEGRILRTHTLRSTWHFVLPADLRWLQLLVGPRVCARMATYYWRNGLTDAVFARSQAVLREALGGGRQLVRKEIAAAFTRGRVATAAQARRGLELLKGKELRRVEAGGRTYWIGDAPARRTAVGSPVHLLQAFDEYIIGYTESRKVLAVAGQPDAPTGAPRYSNVLTYGGQMIGLWRTVADSEEALVDVHLARPLNAATRNALEDELERYGQFLQLPVRLVAKRRARSGGRAQKRSSQFARRRSQTSAAGS